MLGVRDYARKTRFRKVLLGLSGGIDSALTAAIAADAMGPENVLGVMMPSLYSSQGSVDDSVELARNLGIQALQLPISPIMETYEATLAGAFHGLQPDVTEENIQSRIRGNLLMALSNKFGSLLLTTGNKSEMSVGYCTLYGDMNGGLAVIADLPKMMVYRVSRWRNQRKPDIPESTLTKAPSAELRPDQTDQDSLPPYELLDQILELHVEECQSAEEIIAQGFDEDDGPQRAPAGPHRGVQKKAGRAGSESDLTRFRHRLANANCHGRNRTDETFDYRLGKTWIAHGGRDGPQGTHGGGRRRESRLCGRDSRRAAAGQRTGSCRDDHGQSRASFRDQRLRSRGTWRPTRRSSWCRRLPNPMAASP